VHVESISEIIKVGRGKGWAVRVGFGRKATHNNKRGVGGGEVNERVNRRKKKQKGRVTESRNQLKLKLLKKKEKRSTCPIRPMNPHATPPKLVIKRLGMFGCQRD